MDEQRWTIHTHQALSRTRGGQFSCLIILNQHNDGFWFIRSRFRRIIALCNLYMLFRAELHICNEYNYVVWISALFLYLDLVVLLDN